VVNTRKKSNTPVIPTQMGTITRRKLMGPPLTP
jgi:hypothetical protein